MTAVLFAEDPGAVNCVAPIAEALLRRGDEPRLLGSGLATQLLRDRGLDVVPIEDRPLAVRLWEGSRLLLTGTSENRELPAFGLIAEARVHDVPSVAIIDSGANAAERFRGNGSAPLAHAPDDLLVPDEATSAAFVALGLAPEHIHVVGHPNDDRVRALAEKLALEGRDAVRASVVPRAGDRPVVVFVSEISAGLDPGGYCRDAAYTLHGRGGRALRSEIVAEELLDAVASFDIEESRRPYLVLRRHPKETPADLAGLIDEFDEVSTHADPHRLLFAADIVVGMTTMLLTEAQLMGVPALGVLPRERERDWLELLRSGAIATVTTREDLIAALQSRLTAPRLPRTAAAAGSTVDRILSLLDRMAR